MNANTPDSGSPLIDQAVAWLREKMPRGWSIESPVRETLDLSAPVDSKISLRGPNGTMTAIAVDERQSLSPRTVLSLLSPQVQTARNMGAHLPFMVVAPWLSGRTQELLAEQGLSYIDLTGNALLRIDNPPFYLQTTGADRNPAPKDRGQAQLRGAKAARLIRLLIDVRPPYDLGELAATTKLAPGYVSRLLDTLDREALIERRPRRPVESVDVAALIRRWASSYDVFRTNDALTLIAPSGIEAFLEQVARPDVSEAKMVITGSFAAAAMMAPIAAPALLVAYSQNPQALAAEHGLLPSEEGADVVLLSPFDPVAQEGASFHNHLTYAAPSQVAVDCLTGNGRMPAEGEALLEWMVGHEAAWRAAGLAELRLRDRGT
jgi:Transcriptional regulator, AbiEi antitoxin, Type IV TA system